MDHAGALDQYRAQFPISVAFLVKLFIRGAPDASMLHRALICRTALTLMEWRGMADTEASARSALRLMDVRRQPHGQIWDIITGGAAYPKTLGALVDIPNFLGFVYGRPKPPPGNRLAT